MLRFIARMLAQGFFGNIYVSGQPYLGKSCIWAANHTSAIVDPVILFGMSPMKLRPVAKHTLWDHPVMRPLLQNVRAIPVYRAQDMLGKRSSASEHESARVDDGDEARRKLNQSAFRASAQALVDGDCLVIFPEGISHDLPKLQRLRSGASLMAIEAVERSGKPDFQAVIQPVAIDYFEKDEFRSDLGIYFCQPVFVTHAEVRADDLNKAIEESLKEGLAQFDSWTDKRNCLFLFETAYGRRPHSPREFRIFQESYFHLFQEKEDFMNRVQTMRRLLQAMRVSPYQLMWGEKHSTKSAFVFALLVHGFYHFVICVPIQSISVPVWFLPFRLCDILARLTTKERDVVATMKIAHACYLFPLWSVCTGFGAAAAANVFGATGILRFFALGVFFGFATLLGSLLVSERKSFFPGYWKLARLKFLHPRAWLEVMEEWHDFCESVFRCIEAPLEVSQFQHREAR